MKFPISDVRARFPALAIRDDGCGRIYADNPAGTQVPASVAEAVSQYMLTTSANAGGHFNTSVETDRITLKSHDDAAVFLGASSGREVVIGQSMTALTFHMSRSICRDFEPGDEIIITRMEHEGNVGPWLTIAEDMGLVVRWLDFNRETWVVEPEDLSALLTDRTRLLALNHASNMTGSINDVAGLSAMAKDAGALVFVDAVQLAPHHLVDVQALGCDFLACSSYKFFGPHLGLLWGRKDILQDLYPYKGRCVSDDTPDRFELGTPQFELLAGLSATVAYFEDLGRLESASDNRRALITTAYQMSRDYEEPLTNMLIDGLAQIPGVSIYGITNPNRVKHRVPTVSIRHSSVKPTEIARALAFAGIHVWHGHNYAYEPARALNLPLDEGVVRIGLAHYNTNDEVESIIDEVQKTVARTK
ncbi:cysteine desulfurase-like protein [uncultured Ruegeria sp.]|uniref:cysteine desulfurase-like protein n=1 Tax=uncultured Ruegeria sp. TaxID=259304 RepID=UPI0026366499|nr:cysteine desulfurase-like protein [uncultured Ruegeria sp.]